MLFNSFSLLCFFVGYIYCATNICVEMTPCKCVLSAGGTIDLSSVGTVDHPRFYEIRSNNTNDTLLYSYNPCYGFDSPEPYTMTKPENKPCKSAAACVRTPGGNSGDLPEEHIIGEQSTASFGTEKSIGFHINYTVSNPAKQKVLVILECVNDTEIHTLTVESPETDVNKNVVMNLRSKCACPNGCASTNPSAPDTGLSTGSKLLIAFFTILLAYFVIGIVWNFCNGAQGLELVPNLDFWNELPKLIVEGVAFSCSCFGKQSSYGEV